MVAPVVAAAGISAAGSLLGGALGAFGSSKANKDAKQMMREQMAWQERMIRKSHRYEVLDLQRAGLNPILSGFGGSGAGHGSVAVPQVQNEGAALGEGVSNAASKALMAENIMSQTEATKAQTLKSIADADLSSAHAAQARADTLNKPKQGDLIDAQTDHTRTQIGQLQEQIHLTDAQTRKIHAEIPNIVKNGGLIDAQTKAALASAGLSEAKIAEVEPLIRKYMAETRATDATVGSKSMLSIPGDILNELLSNSSESAGRSVGKGVKDLPKYLESPNMRRNNERARRNSK